MKTTQDRRRWQVPFFTIWAGQAISLLGSNLAQFALVWWLTKTTGSATILATASLVALLPAIVLGPFAGALVDRWNRRTVMILADALVALGAAWLVYLFWADAMQVWHVYVLVLLRALGGAFHWPAMQVSTSLMVPEEHLARIGGLNQTLHGLVNIVSPPLGAILLSVLPFYAVMGIDVVTALCAIGLLLSIRIPQPRLAPEATASLSVASVWADVRVGLRYVWHWPGLRWVLVIATLLNLIMNPAFSLLPLLVTEHFGGGALELGWMESAWGVGVVLGGLLLSVWGGFRRRMWTAIMGLAGIGVGTLLVGLAPGWALSLAVAAFALHGFMNPLANGPLFAIVQAKVAPEMQGRVFTVIMSASSAMTPLGLAVAGPMADGLGLSAWFAFAGVSCLLIALSIPLLPAVMNLENSQSLHDQATPEVSSPAPGPESPPVGLIDGG